MAKDTTNRAPSGLVPLDEAHDYDIAKGNPDPRGWDVFAAGSKVGTVDHLIADLTAMKVRYLVVKLEDSLAAGQHDRHVLVPVGTARLDEHDDRVILPNTQPAMLASLPAYRLDAPITRADEDLLRERLTGAPAPSGGERDYYDAEHYDENRFFGTRAATAATAAGAAGAGAAGAGAAGAGAAGAGAERVTRVPIVDEERAVGTRKVQAGEVDVRTHADTEHVPQPATRMREDVDVTREPLQADASGQVADAEPMDIDEEGNIAGRVKRSDREARRDDEERRTP